MSKEKLTLNNLLTWEDVIALGDPRGETACFIKKSVFKDCCLTKDDRKEFSKRFKEYICDAFTSRFPESNVPIEDLDIRMMMVKDEEGKWGITYSMPHFVNSIYGLLAENNPDFKDKTLLGLMFAATDVDGIKEAATAVFKVGTTELFLSSSSHVLLPL